MKNENIVEGLRDALGLELDSTDFSREIIMHLNSSLAVLNQNGIGNHLIADEASKWRDFLSVDRPVPDEALALIPTYVFIRTKILFDPPPPSTVEFYKSYADELLWRLRLVYDAPVQPVNT